VPVKATDPGELALAIRDGLRHMRAVVVAVGHSCRAIFAEVCAVAGVAVIRAEAGELRPLLAGATQARRSPHSSMTASAASDRRGAASSRTPRSPPGARCRHRRRQAPWVIVPHVLANNSLFSYSAPGSAGLLEGEVAHPRDRDRDHVRCVALSGGEIRPGPACEPQRFG